MRRLHPDPAVEDRAIGRHCRNIATRAERAFRAGQDDRAAILIRNQLFDSARKLDEQLPRQGVADLGIVDRESRDLLVETDENQLTH